MRYGTAVSRVKYSSEGANGSEEGNDSELEENKAGERGSYQFWILGAENRYPLVLL